jgi:galactokinase
MTHPDLVATLSAAVVSRFGIDPGAVRVVRSPYRICPLGAHVDHQLGVVTAMAIDRGVALAYAASEAPEVRLDSLDYPGRVAFDLGAIPPRRADDWGNFARGAAEALRRAHPLPRGLVGVVGGQLPGGGVSSSAAVAIAYLLALADANNIPLPPAGRIALGRQVENAYLGLRSGILDQAAIVLSRRGHLTRIDCRTTAHELIPAPAAMPPHGFLLADSGVRSPLTGTDYNRRVAECAAAARTLLDAAGRPDAHAVLGEVAPEEYREHRHRLDPVPARRAAHYFSEIDRVGRGVAAWAAGDLATFGRLMTESGASSIHQYECGSPPLIDLHETLVATPGVLGARFSGAGFRGYCVALVRPGAIADVAARVRDGYARRHPDLAAGVNVVPCASADGAAILDLLP